MTRIPSSALWLGIAGLIPFLWGAATIFVAPLWNFGSALFGPSMVGPFVLVSYGTIILAFMSGVLWGFATKAEGRQAALGYGLSVVPALWAFFFVGGGTMPSTSTLILGFLGLLGLDVLFWRWGLAPPWWMSLRLGLTVVVVACLTVALL
ncbi:MAG: DUF3429 domain-containing protein [Rhodobacteraceae bacterium]|nr:DUF3429 domain-containing protein [Paracoccaceae bacterium]